MSESTTEQTNSVTKDESLTQSATGVPASAIQPATSHQQVEAQETQAPVVEVTETPVLLQRQAIASTSEAVIAPPITEKSTTVQPSVSNQSAELVEEVSPTVESSSNSETIPDEITSRNAAVSEATTPQESIVVQPRFETETQNLTSPALSQQGELSSVTEEIIQRRDVKEIAIAASDSSLPEVQQQHEKTLSSDSGEASVSPRSEPVSFEGIVPSEATLIPSQLEAQAHVDTEVQNPPDQASATEVQSSLSTEQPTSEIPKSPIQQSIPNSTPIAQAKLEALDTAELPTETNLADTTVQRQPQVERSTIVSENLAATVGVEPISLSEDSTAIQADSVIEHQTRDTVNRSDVAEAGTLQPPELTESVPISAEDAIASKPIVVQPLQERLSSEPNTEGSEAFSETTQPAQTKIPNELKFDLPTAIGESSATEPLAPTQKAITLEQSTVVQPKLESSVTIGIEQVTPYNPSTLVGETTTPTTESSANSEVIARFGEVDLPPVTSPIVQRQQEEERSATLSENLAAISEVEQISLLEDPTTLQLPTATPEFSSADITSPDTALIQPRQEKLPSKLSHEELPQATQPAEPSVQLFPGGEPETKTVEKEASSSDTVVPNELPKAVVLDSNLTTFPSEISSLVQRKEAISEVSEAAKSLERTNREGQATSVSNLENTTPKSASGEATVVQPFLEQQPLQHDGEGLSEAPTAALEVVQTQQPQAAELVAQQTPAIESVQEQLGSEPLPETIASDNLSIVQPKPENSDSATEQLSALPEFSPDFQVHQSTEDFQATTELAKTSVRLENQTFPSHPELRAKPTDSVDTTPSDAVVIQPKLENLAFAQTQESLPLVDSTTDVSTSVPESNQRALSPESEPVKVKPSTVTSESLAEETISSNTPVVQLLQETQLSPSSRETLPNVAESTQMPTLSAAVGELATEHLDTTAAAIASTDNAYISPTTETPPPEAIHPLTPTQDNYPETASEANSDVTVAQLFSETKDVPVLPTVLENLAQLKPLGHSSALGQSAVEATPTSSLLTHPSSSEELPPMIQRKVETSVGNSLETMLELPRTSDEPKSISTSLTRLDKASDPSSSLSLRSDPNTDIPTSWSSIAELLGQSTTVQKKSSVIQRRPDERHAQEELVFTPEGFQRADSISDRASQTTRSGHTAIQMKKGDRASTQSTNIPIQMDSETESQPITITAPNSSSETDSRSLEILAQEIYNFIRQRLEIERERHGYYYSGRLPW